LLWLSAERKLAMFLPVSLTCAPSVPLARGLAPQLISYQENSAEYFWNGRTLYANDWLNNNTGTPRPFTKSNQWEDSIGGPIVKAKKFFFLDTEGLNFCLGV
jgi:hypothetical protein